MASRKHNGGTLISGRAKGTERVWHVSFDLLDDGYRDETGDIIKFMTKTNITRLIKLLMSKNYLPVNLKSACIKLKEKEH